MNSIAAADAARECNAENSQEYVNSIDCHSLVYSSSARQFRNSGEKLPWTVCATGPSDDASRTYFIAFSDTATYSESVFHELCLESLSISGSFVGKSLIGLNQSESTFDPTFIVPFLSENAKDKVVFCGFATGGIAAMTEFVCFLGNENVNISRLLSNGRYDIIICRTITL